MKYTGKDIKAYKGLEGVRKTPAMYIGNIEDFSGARNMFFEILSNSMDEAIAGHASIINVTFPNSFTCCVQDNGRGIPIDWHEGEDKVTAQAIFDTLHVGGKFDAGNYKVSSGLHGVGSSVCNALSTIFIASIIRDGKIYRIVFNKGKKVHEKFINVKSKATGTFVMFKLDRSIFTKYMKYQDVRWELEQASYLMPGITFNFNSLKEKTVFKSNGLIDMYKKYHGTDKNIVPAFNLGTYMDEDINNLSIVLGWNSSNEFKHYLFCNNTPQISGSHLTGFKKGMTKAFNKYLTKEYSIINSNDIRTGCVLLLSVKHKDAKYSSQTKTDLVSNVIRAEVETAAYEAISRYLNENQDKLQILLTRMLAVAQNRIKISELKSVLVKETSTLGTLPGKLSDCYSKNTDINELFLVEGNSATGPVKNSRDRTTQAVLPMKGKLINTYKNNKIKVLKNETISNIIVSVGTGVLEKFKYENLRYGKIIVITDADYDGYHIATLLLTMFYDLMPQLVTEGHVYIGIPPLYSIKKGKQKEYFHTEEELDILLLSQKLGKLSKREILKLYRIYEKALVIYPKSPIILDYATVMLKHKINSLRIGRQRFDMAEEEGKNILKITYLNIIQTYTKIDITGWVKYLKESVFNTYYEGRVKTGHANILQQIKTILIKYKELSTIKRYKGLGEMQTEELGQTCVNAKSRLLKQVNISDVENAKASLELLMGDESKGRQQLIMEYIKDDDLEY